MREDFWVFWLSFHENKPCFFKKKTKKRAIFRKTLWKPIYWKVTEWLWRRKYLAFIAIYLCNSITFPDFAANIRLNGIHCHHDLTSIFLILFHIAFYKSNSLTFYYISILHIHITYYILLFSNLTPYYISILHTCHAAYITGAAIYDLDLGLL